MILPTLTLKRSMIRKVMIEGRVKDDKKGADIKVRNAFGILAGITCPGATSVCYSTDKITCYAARAESGLHGAAVRGVVGWNTAVLFALGDDIDALEIALSNMIDEFRTDLDAENLRRAKRNDVTLEPQFRIHWDGDSYSLAYAEAWSRVMQRNLDIQFWQYTRSFVSACNVVPILAAVPNLNLYLSVDNANWETAIPVLAAFPSVKVATLGTDSDDAARLLERIGRGRAPLCPENTFRMPLMVSATNVRQEAKKGDRAIGACISCGLCPKGRADVRFSIAGANDPAAGKYSPKVRRAALKVAAV